MANPKTPNLGLNKVDRASPSTTAFNTKPIIDDNADVVDALFDESEVGGGHTHDGTPGNGPQIGTAGIQNGAITAAKVAADVATQAELDALATSKVSNTGFTQIAGANIDVYDFKTGHYGTDLASTGLPVNGEYWDLIAHHFTPTSFDLFAFGKTNLNRLYARNRNGGTWSAWHEIWHSTNAPSSLNNAGYIKLPNGWIFQWATQSIVSSGDIIFPIAFVQACFGVVPNVDNGGIIVNAYSKTLTKVSVTLSAAATGNVTIFAIGK